MFLNQESSGSDQDENNQFQGFIDAPRELEQRRKSSEEIQFNELSLKNPQSQIDDELKFYQVKTIRKQDSSDEGNDDQIISFSTITVKKPQNEIKQQCFGNLQTQNHLRAQMLVQQRGQLETAQFQTYTQIYNANDQYMKNDDFASIDFQKFAMQSQRNSSRNHTFQYRIESNLEDNDNHNDKGVQDHPHQQDQFIGDDTFIIPSENVNDNLPELLDISKLQESENLQNNDIIDVTRLVENFPEHRAYPKPLRTLEYTDYKLFLNSPVPKGGMVQCTLVRENSGINHFSPRFELYFSHGLKFLMGAKKKPYTNKPYYLVSMHCKTLERDSPFYLGKLRGESDSSFALFDDGENPKSKSLVREIRHQIGAIFFEKSNKKSERKPRELKILLPSIKEDGVPQVFIPRTKNDGLQQLYERGEHAGLTLFESNKPQWDEETQGFVLNFHKRVSVASIKNFQLIQTKDTQINIYLQYGKVKDNQFTLDFQYPLTPLQAFLIGLSSFDFKLDF